MKAEKKNERNMNRQERRHQEKLEKKQGKKEYEMKYDLIQPWSVPIMKTTLPPHVLQTMIEISDLVIADKDATSVGESLVGQIEKELRVEHNILEQTGVMDFFMGAVRQFVIQCKKNLLEKVDFEQKEWLIQMLIMWIVSQQPGEYNPLHEHTSCKISAVMYLKVPKMLPDRKKHKQSILHRDDGSILFTSNASRDTDLSYPQISFPPQAGDFFIFGAQQQHAVYPYRCEEGQKDTERRSISFNATFQSTADFDREQKNIKKYLQNETKK